VREDLVFTDGKRKDSAGQRKIAEKALAGLRGEGALRGLPVERVDFLGAGVAQEERRIVGSQA
jgi:hypothetical protein